MSAIVAFASRIGLQHIDRPAQAPTAGPSAGRATTVEAMKNAGQPIDCASTPASGPTQTRPTEAKALSSANWVALKRWLHRLIRNARKAAVPMPLVMFSLAIAISRPPSTGVASASLTKPQSNGGIVRPGSAPRPFTASHQKPRLPSICRMPNSSSARHRPRRSISAPAISAPTIVSHRPITLLTTPTSAVLYCIACSRNGVSSAPANASPQLVEHDEGEEGRGARLREVAASGRRAGSRSGPAAPPRSTSGRVKAMPANSATRSTQRCCRVAATLLPANSGSDAARAPAARTRSA